MLKKWNPEEIEILKENWTLPMKEIVPKLPDRNRKTIYWKLNDLGFIRQTYRRYTSEEDKYIRDNSGTKGNREIARHLKRTEKSVSKRMIVLNIKRSESELFRLKSNNAGCFKKGRKSELEWPQGYIRISHDTANCLSFYDIKLGNKFVRLSRYLYQMYTGEQIGSGDIIYHRDGDSMNILKENLVKINRRELMAKNADCDMTIVKRIMGIKDPVLVRDIIDNHPELIELQRKILKVNNKINGSNSKNKPEAGRKDVPA